MSPGSEMTAGPPRVIAAVTADVTTVRSCAGLISRPVYTDAGAKNWYGFSSSTVWLSSMLLSVSPASTISGTPSRRASSIPLIRWATPGPAVPHTTTGWPVSRASAVAAKTPYSSLRTWTKSTWPLRRIASITGLRASPTIP